MAKRLFDILTDKADKIFNKLSDKADKLSVRANKIFDVLSDKADKFLGILDNLDNAIDNEFNKFFDNNVSEKGKQDKAINKKSKQREVLTYEERIGKWGEYLIEEKLRYINKKIGEKGKILRNVYLPKYNGETSEIDVAYITQKGIFVFESKNYSGWIFGNERNEHWTVTLFNEKNQFYNPVMQNRTHLKWMKEFVGEDIPLFSIIVFSERCELKKVTTYSDDVKVIKVGSILETLRDFWSDSPDMVSDERIEELYARLKERTNVDRATKEAHVENIRKNTKGATYER
ncbi:MAG: NERD domain-containing protein [Butyrivibrio sp.]|nr:NERD domain-containing protein [Butyrivibrio sp.]